MKDQEWKHVVEKREGENVRSCERLMGIYRGIYEE